MANGNSEAGARLLDDISGLLSKYVVLSRAQTDVMALWVIHSHAIEAAEFTPYLHIYSPALRSGKTRLLEVLRLVVAKPWFTGRVTAAVLVRKTDKDHPTLLLDESDAAFSEQGYGEGLRGILNTGFERDGTTSLCVPGGVDKWTPRNFSTFCPKAVAGIGRLPATVEDRSIHIELKRKLRAESRERFRKKKVAPMAEELKRGIEAWVSENLDSLRTADPLLPDELNDRQQDVCEPLLAIADRFGGEWPARARHALVELCRSRTAGEDDSDGLKLLADVRTVFEAYTQDRMSTDTLLNHLCAMEESPWGEYDHGGPLTAYRLARLLRPFGISPRDIRFEKGTRKGYRRVDFGDAWERYLPPCPSPILGEGQQGRQAADYAGSSQLPEGQHSHDVADLKNANTAEKMGLVAAVAPFEPTIDNRQAHGANPLPPTAEPGNRPSRPPNGRCRAFIQSPTVED
jgi:hypothetical protein